MKKDAIPLFAPKDQQNYRLALTAARATFAAKKPETMADRSGCLYDSTSACFTVVCLNHPFTVTYPAGMVTATHSDLEPVFALQLIMINYLARADGTPLTYQYITYRHLDGGNAFYNAFKRTAIDPLLAFGSQPDRLLTATVPFGGTPHSLGGATGVLLFILPRFPLWYQIWPGDDECPPQANILFDESANHYLHTEDVAVCENVTNLLLKQLQ